MKADIVRVVRQAQALARAAGPYLLIELVLPGGTLIALALYLYRAGHLRRFGDVGTAAVGVLRTAGRLFDQLALAWQPSAGRPHSGSPREPVAGLPTHLLLPGR